MRSQQTGTVLGEGGDVLGEGGDVLGEGGDVSREARQQPGDSTHPQWYPEVQSSEEKLQRASAVIRKHRRNAVIMEIKPTLGSWEK